MASLPTKLWTTTLQFGFHLLLFITDLQVFFVQLREQAMLEIAAMNFNEARLRFDALIDKGKGMYEPLCAPVYSQPLRNMSKSNWVLHKIL